MSLALQSAVDSVSGDTAVATFGSAVTAGSFLVVVALWDGGGSTVVSISDAQGDDFVLLEGPTQPPGGDSTQCWIVESAKGGATSVTVEITGPFLQLIALEYPASLGLLSTTPDQFATANASGTALSSGATAETTNANDLLICYGGSEADNASFIAGADFAIEAAIDDATIGQCMFVEDQQVSSEGEYTGTATMSASQRWTCSIVAIKLAAPTFSIAGSAGITGATITWTGPSSGSLTAGSGGAFTIPNLADGSYTITPTLAGYTFAPTHAVEVVDGADITGVDFTPTANPPSGATRSTRSK
jgi:hypothetical protein